MPGASKGFENDFNVASGRQLREQTDTDLSVLFPANEKENSSRENNVAKIKVVVSWQVSVCQHVCASMLACRNMVKL